MRAVIHTTTGRSYSGEIEHTPDGFNIRSGKPGRVPFVPHGRVEKITSYRYPVTGERSTDRYLPLAQEYVRLVATGEPHVTVTLAKRHGVEIRQMRQRLNRVRKAGLLTPGIRGYGSQSQLTEKAKALLLQG